jgi:beta-glucanase (GH16 family)
MLPEDDAYGSWPLSGEIDLMEARGNAPSYPNGGNNVVRSTLNYGPLPGLIKSLFGWQEFKRTSLANDFHTYALEWDENAMRFYIDTRLHSMLALSSFKGGFFKRAGFPTTAHNGTDTEVVVQDPWTNSRNVSVPAAAPYDQPFYLIIDLAVGGTSGWFPDGVAGKPWYDNSGASAMLDFAQGHETWTKTWPQDNKRDFVM